jgi:hypothetical protein
MRDTGTAGETFSETTLDRRIWLSAIAAVVVRPWLWWTAVRQLFRVATPGWWRRAPFLPRPDPDYTRFRLETAYGRDARLDGDDLVTYLEWCRHAR